MNIIKEAVEESIGKPETDKSRENMKLLLSNTPDGLHREKNES